MERSTSTLESLTGLKVARRGRLWRHAGLALMLLIPASSFLGIYGPSERTIETSNDQYQMSLTYGSVVRSGEAVPMTISLTRPGGFDRPVTVVFEQRVFDRFDFQNWYPNPSAEIGEGPNVVYEFDPPDGDTLAIALDARVAPTQWGGVDTYRVWVEEESRPVLETEYTVWVVP
jgi:hypothetical protein